ncbi:phage major capsid protein [Piscibacillus sp. B03]|uniref:phage major capsid protein n=1 Tax=Piscibacillus sp. B03 TaxID=3457430 RepID=UPI003FCECAE2
MTIKFNNFEEKKLAFAKATKEGTEEEQSQALNEMLESLAQDVQSDILNQVNTQMADNAVLQSRGQNVLTSDEYKFFNAVVEEGGFTDKEMLPVTTQERVFEDLRKEHPLLDALGLQNLGAVTEYIFSNPEGAAVWGPLFDGIKGQLNAAFRKVSISQLKLTAFIPLSNDMLKLGPEWIERYVRTMMTEAMAVGLEQGFVAGTGQNQPIGLLKNVDSETGAVSDKPSSGTLTFKRGETMIDELAGVAENLAIYTDANGEEQVRKVENKLVMVMNPKNSFRIKANATIQNASGVYVTNYPLNFKDYESIFVPEGKVLFFLQGEYLAAMGGRDPIKKFEQTLALEDATVYIAKQYATGKPKDNNAAAVYDLDLGGTTTTTTTTSA